LKQADPKTNGRQVEELAKNTEGFTMTLTKYAIVGTGGRARMYYDALLSTYKDTSKLVALCDSNQTRMDFTNVVIIEDYKSEALPTYRDYQFKEMIAQEKPDVVIVTSIDRTHHRYICQAMELGCDVISEKPMTTDAKKCQQIIDTIDKTGRKLRVTFNYRYSPQNTKIRELVMKETIGQVTSVHFEWLLNIKHGADYFRRWHRDKRNSGGLLVHKSTHHFDLVNFWLGTSPETVFALGDLRFYGRENAEERGVTDFYHRSYGSEAAKQDPFALHMDESKYIRDQSVFGDGINIEDTMSVLVRYKNQALLTYSLNAYMPWEGYRVCFNGTQGRIEYEVREASYVNAGGDFGEEGAVRFKSIKVYPMFGKPYDVEIETGEGAHGGGDRVMLEDIFGKPPVDPFNRAADYRDGAKSILTGIAANKSIATGLPVQVETLVKI
jgi:predicted dehydrogenase